MAGPDNYALISCGGSPSPAQPAGKRTCRTCIKRILCSIAFRLVGTIGLIIALFGGGLCVLIDLPDQPANEVVDAVMTSIMVFFGLEIVLRCIVEFHEYAFTFFFWMDALGTLSMVFEISFLLGATGATRTAETGMSTTMVRAARATRVAARAGRLSKVLRCLPLFYAGRRGASSCRVKDAGHHAKVLGERLTQVLATKAAMLTVALIVGVPILNIGGFPEDDFSLRLTSLKLEADYARAYEAVANRTGGARAGGTAAATGSFQASVRDIVSFYDELDYFPYRLAGYDEHLTVHGRPTVILGASLVRRAEPLRKQNIFRQEVSRCLVARPQCEDGEGASIYFDFKIANQHEVAIDFCLILFIIFCMGVAACDLHRSINRVVVAPLEKMLQTAHSMAAVLNQVLRRNQVSDLESELEDDDELLDETEILERIFKKMALLTSVFVETNVLDEARMQTLDPESKGVIVEVMQYGRNEARRSSRKGGLFAKGAIVSELPVCREEIESWGLNLLSMDVTEQQKVVNYIIFDSSIGQATGRIWISPDTFQAFSNTVRKGYHDNPYHSFTHGCDVVSSCYRILLQVRSDEWLSDVDTSALLVSAMCHDIGHPGKTNPFLVETSDELALRYNDKSPLENMHCARLFEICTDLKTNVFERFDRASYKQARSVCIAAILYTDNALHFDLVKEVRKIYETSSDLCDSQMNCAENLGGTPYLQDVVCKNTMLWIKVILHMADVSNPLKTFEMNKLWAMRVVDEFFAQGDEEKKLGIPVGMLNDRDKVSRSGAEHGFINFLLAPLVFSVVYVFPMLHPLAAQMATNMTEWHKTWVKEANPSIEDVRKREEDVQKVRETVTALSERGKGRWYPSETQVH